MRRACSINMLFLALLILSSTLVHGQSEDAPSSCLDAVREATTDEEATRCKAMNITKNEPTAVDRNVLCALNDCDWTVFEKHADILSESCRNDSNGRRIAVIYRIMEAVRNAICLLNEQGEYCDSFLFNRSRKSSKKSPLEDIDESVLCVPCMDKFAQYLLEAYGKLSASDQEILDTDVFNPNLRITYEPFGEKCDFDVEAAIDGEPGAAAGLMGFTYTKNSK